ncbi:hypothetical protein AGDE_15269 [Angomonas deanei]|uniref:Uncharacterized protein n=1 Tax=Angomonas deanei TaxID=59799 RepID=A0A7G2CW83_9TRYP|nr:hypothetical protein AGDE_15269 [Angomonas deanei]CAD2222693.1 hypothetical protein, conserved [Angomonas deanei]|eukprot:EPY19375.1 hypothetical protein AGDE_15269 [Angomonas deanei]
MSSHVGNISSTTYEAFSKTVAARREAEDTTVAAIISTYGTLAIGCSAYPALLSGAQVLLHHALTKLLNEIHSQIILLALLEKEKKQETKKSENSTREARFAHGITLAAEESARELFSHWGTLFGRYEGEALYAQYVEEEDVVSSGRKWRVNPPDGAGLSETSCLFLMLLVVLLRQQLRRERQSVHEVTNFSESDDEDVAQESDGRRQLALDALETMSTSLQSLFTAYIEGKLQQEGRQSSNVLACRPLLWDALLLKQQWIQAILAATTAKGEQDKEEEKKRFISFRRELENIFQFDWLQWCSTYQTLTALQPTPRTEGNNNVMDEEMLKGYAYHRQLLLKSESNHFSDSTQTAVLEEIIQKESGSGKRPRDASEDNPTKPVKKKEEGALASPTHQLRVYLTRVFFPVFDRRCFSLLVQSKARPLTGALHQLHEVLTKVGQYTTEELVHRVDGVLQAHGRQWCGEPHLEGLHPRDYMLSHLRGDYRLILMLVHSVLTLLRWRGVVATETDYALLQSVIPSLRLLSGDTSGVTEFALLAVLLAEVPSLPWSTEGIALTWLRYSSFGEMLTFGRSKPFSDVVQDMREWIRKGGGGAQARLTGSESATFLNRIDEALKENHPVYTQLASSGGTQAIYEELDACLRSVIPIRFPPVCGLFLLVSAYETLQQHLGSMRGVMEAGRREAVEDGATDTLYDRDGTFCSAHDVWIFRGVVLSVHRGVFGFRQQSPGLMRLWFAYLVHVFLYIVPPAPAGEVMQLLSHSWQMKETVRNCLGEEVHRTGWRALQAGDDQSSQTDLRVVLGELLADLAVMPLADPDALLECPWIIPRRTSQDATLVHWIAREEHEAPDEIAALATTLPQLVLENLCFFLRIDTQMNPLSSRSEAHFPEIADTFLGLAGLTAFCRRWEACVEPGSVTDRRVAHLLRCIWAVVNHEALRG